MAVGCSENCMKYILLFFNLIIFILGIIGIALGSIVLIKKDILLDGLKEVKSEDVLKGFDSKTIDAGAVILIVASVVIIFIAFFGCFGAWKENSCLLGVYSTIMSVLLILQVVVFVMVLIAQPKLEIAVKAALKELTDNSNKYGKSVVQDIFNKNKCCGIDDPQEAINKGFTCEADYQGCYTLVKKAIDKNVPLAIGIAIAIVVVQLFLIIFACCLCSSRRGERVS